MTSNSISGFKTFIPNLKMNPIKRKIIFFFFRLIRRQRPHFNLVLLKFQNPLIFFKNNIFKNFGILKIKTIKNRSCDKMVNMYYYDFSHTRNARSKTFS